MGEKASGGREQFLMAETLVDRKMCGSSSGKS
jgi:hypothetical protein